MDIFKNITQTYKSIKYRNKIVNINLADLIKDNFESACSFYRGFFGEPQIDSELFTAYKNVRLKTSFISDLKDCSDSINRKGWELIYTKTGDGGPYMKIIMVPSHEIRNYMNQRALGKDPSETVSLYKKLGGNVI